jgi:hypothetical protein
MDALVRYLRCGLVVLAIAAALFSIFMSFMSLPEPGRNPASPEFGWLQWQWAVACLAATVLLVIAIVATRGWTRCMLIVVLLANWGFGIAPGLQIYRYRMVGSEPFVRVAIFFPTHPAA